MNEVLNMVLPWLSFIMVACLVYAGGLVAKRFFGKKPWWRNTVELHPIVVGGLLGTLPWPVPESLRDAMGTGNDLLAHVVFFAFAGMVSQGVYKRVHARAQVAHAKVKSK